MVVQYSLNVIRWERYAIDAKWYHFLGMQDHGVLDEKVRAGYL